MWEIIPNSNPPALTQRPAGHNHAHRRCHSKTLSNVLNHHKHQHRQNSHEQQHHQTHPHQSPIQRQPRQKFRGRVPHRLARLSRNPSGMAPTSMTGTIPLPTGIPNKCSPTRWAMTMTANPPCSDCFATCRAVTRRFMSLIAGRRPTASSCRHWNHCNCSNRSPRRASGSHFFCFPARTPRA